MVMKILDKKVALVTGSSSGLGRHIAKLLCKEGLIVYVTARRKEKLLSLKKECLDEKLSGEIHVVPGDLLNYKFRISLVKLIIKKQGQIDYLFNNAGFGRSVKFENQNSKEINEMFQVNVVAYQHLTTLVLPQMRKQKKGRLIHIGSVVTFTPLPYFTTYNSTKSALYGFNRSLRYELKDSEITSTIVLPARMKTGFADNAFDCYKKFGRDMCVKTFNKIAGDPFKVAKVIVKNKDKGKEVITPTFKAKFWYFTRYFGGIVDLVMKNILGPKELNHLNQIELNPEYLKK